MWGKFGQPTDLDNREFVNNYNTLLQRITNNDIITRELNIINENCVEHVYKAKNESVKDAEYISEVTAVFTTSNARLRLYNMLSWFDPSQVIYCDTDSCFILYDPDNPLHKEPSNSTSDRPDTISFGDGLGQWKDELKGGYISEMIVGGAKSYAYIDSDGKTKIVQKGITLDHANSGVFTFEAFKQMVLEGKFIESVPRGTFKTDNKSRSICTKNLQRNVKLTIESKRAASDEYDTIPFGYDVE